MKGRTRESRTAYALLPVVAATVVSIFAALASATSAETAETAARVTLTARGSMYGRVLFDGRGYVLYGFTADRTRRSVCAGACATAWPPYLVSGSLRAGRGISKRLLGTIRRPDSKRQLTYAGRPLYFYVGDRKPGQILCQGVTEFGGDWLVVRPNGALVR
jgi:predicted lipoprotein with Yx(FWY)xxD motif